VISVAAIAIAIVVVFADVVAGGPAKIKDAIVHHPDVSVVTRRDLHPRMRF